MSIFARINKQINDEEDEDQDLGEISADHSAASDVPDETLIFDMQRRKEFEQHLLSPNDEFWCQACNIYCSTEEDMIEHMQTELHKEAEAKWKKENPEDIFPTQRKRSSKPSRKLTKLRALEKRKELRRKGLLDEAKTGHSKDVKAKQTYNRSKEQYHAVKREEQKRREK